MGANKTLDRAIIMATNDGWKWPDLDSTMENAYLHNAKVAIETESRPEPKPVQQGTEPEKCYLCKGAEWLNVGEDDVKPCPECNPVGLNPPEEEEPEK